MPASSSSDHRIWLTAIRHARYRVGSMRVTCTLYRVKQVGHPVGYAMKVASPEERYLYPIGCRRASAQALFATVVEHTVAPCTLGDILADLADAGRIGAR